MSDIEERQKAFAADKHKRFEIEMFDSIFHQLSNGQKQHVQRLVENHGCSSREALERAGIKCPVNPIVL